MLAALLPAVSFPTLASSLTIALGDVFSAEYFLGGCRGQLGAARESSEILLH